MTFRFSFDQDTIGLITDRNTPNNIRVEAIAILAEEYMRLNHSKYLPSQDLYRENNYEYNIQNVRRGKGNYLEDAFEMCLLKEGQPKVNTTGDLLHTQRGYVRLRFDNHSIPDFIVKNGNKVVMIELRNRDPTRQMNEEEIDDTVKKFESEEKEFHGYEIVKVLCIPKLKTSGRLRRKLEAAGIHIVETGIQLLYASKTRFKKLFGNFRLILGLLRRGSCNISKVRTSISPSIVPTEVKNTVDFDSMAEQGHHKSGFDPPEAATRQLRKEAPPRINAGQSEYGTNVSTRQKEHAGKDTVLFNLDGNLSSSCYTHMLTLPLYVEMNSPIRLPENH